MAWKAERENVVPVAGGKKVKRQGRSRGEHSVGLMEREVSRAKQKWGWACLEMDQKRVAGLVVGRA